jgi:hypothetical protein
LPAVIVNSVKYNVAGKYRDQFYNISGASGDFLQIGYFNVIKVDTNPGSAISAVAVNPGTVPGTSTIQFTSSGPMVGEVINVVGN